MGWGGKNWSLLIITVLFDRKDLVEYLLLTYTNINVNHRNYYGNTALHFCDKVSILKLFLDRRDLNIQNKWGQTGLHHACYSGRKACVKENILDTRVDALIRDNQGRTARDKALERRYPEIAKIINNSGRTSLLRIPNKVLLYDIVRMIIEEYT